jgi:hypothetical protein
MGRTGKRIMMLSCKEVEYSVDGSVCALSPWNWKKENIVPCWVLRDRERRLFWMIAGITPRSQRQDYELKERITPGSPAGNVGRDPVPGLRPVPAYERV